MACIVSIKGVINRAMVKILEKSEYVTTKGIPKQQIPPNPIIAANSANNVGYRDTLDRVAAVLQLLTELHATEGLSPKAETGHYWIQLMLIDAVKYVSEALGDTTGND